MRRLPVVTSLVVVCAGCGVTAQTSAPSCGSLERVALIAQAVPTAAYVPCLAELPAGWDVTDVDTRRGAVRLALSSDRAEGREVVLLLTRECEVQGATPTAPRADGVRSHLRVDGVTPEYAGTTYDVFAGGCLRTAFAFPRGPHIPLMEDLAAAVSLVPRRELRLDLRDELGVELDG